MYTYVSRIWHEMDSSMDMMDSRQVSSNISNHTCQTCSYDDKPLRMIETEFTIHEREKKTRWVEYVF